jgi:hypothetical protein
MILEKNTSREPHYVFFPVDARERPYTNLVFTRIYDFIF